MDFLKVFYRAPFVGAFALALIFLLQALGHTHMVLLEQNFPGNSLYVAALVEGLIGFGLVLLGSKIGTEVWGTWLGFAGGVQLWNGWCEFSFVYYAQRYAVPALHELGIKTTKPEYLIMPSSLGVVLSIGLFFLLNRETRCNAFRWLHRHLGLGSGEPTPGYKRNFSIIVATEYVSIAWFFYMVLLLLYDRKLLGTHHPVTYGAFFLFVVWGLFLADRLLRFTRATAALRYAIPTAAVWWSLIELLGRWGLLREIWLEPAKYTLEMSLMAAAFAIFVGVSFLNARNRAKGATDTLTERGEYS